MAMAETHYRRIDDGASISAAVRGPANEVVGALTVTIPISQYTREVRGRAIEVATAAALMLSRRLGAPAPSSPYADP
jgi:DNA-binding IclR family transcriptional regulator